MPAVAPTIRQTTLENGVSVLTESLPHTGSVGISVLIDASPGDEPEGKSGLAHLCEHAMFLGTPLRNSQQLASLIDTAGGQMGAFTAPDYTCYYAHVLEDYASYAFDLLGDILVSSEYPEEGIEREKEIICQEIMEYEDCPRDVSLQMIKKLLWPGDRLSRSIIGSVDDVRSLHRDDVVDFVAANYTPDRFIVAAAGAVDHESIVEQSQDAFWTMRGKGQKRQKATVQTRGGVQVCRMNSSQCSFSIAIPSGPFADEDRHHWHVLNNVIGGGMSSRLYQAVREKQGMAYSIHSEILAYSRCGALMVQGVTSPEFLLPCLNTVLFELAGLAVGKNPLTEEEVWKSRMQVRGQSRLAADMIANRVARLATQQFHFDKPSDAQRILLDLDRVEIDGLQELACNRMLNGMSSLAIAVAGNVDEESVQNDLVGLHECFSGLASAD